MATCSDLRTDWLPSRLEQVYQRDRYTLALGLRTLEQRGWLTLSWHPQAARICLGDAPPRVPDTFTFSEQLRHQIGNLALVAMDAIAPWERVLDLQFARRPGEPALWHLYLEVMGNYSNVILANRENVVVAAAHQVSSQQSSLRPIQTGQLYDVPPIPTKPVASQQESLERWRERISLIPGAIRRNLLQTYRGLSSALVLSMLDAAGLNPDQSTNTFTDADWHQLFQRWQEWLQALEQGTFQPGWTKQGYTVMGWGMTQPVDRVQAILEPYYRDRLEQQEFTQLRHQLSQKLNYLLGKLRLKATTFETRLQQSDRADQSREHADLLMAYLHQWQPGMTAITLADFTTGEPVIIHLNPEKNAVQNAQALYKHHQKLKRARGAIEPLLAEVTTELDYLEQVEAALATLTDYHHADDLDALIEIREELIQQHYLEDPGYRPSRASPEASHPHAYVTPTGLDVLVGRNNRQNDQLTFRLAGDYDLWFHSQEIPGGHVLLRLKPGIAPDQAELQFAADLAAYYSRARQSDQVPVIYTEPKYVYKPRGAKPGMTVYKHEQVIWGCPDRGRLYVQTARSTSETNYPS